MAVEHQFDGGYTIIKDAVRAWKQQSKEVFLPLSHPMGEAQVDFGFAQIDLDGLREKVALFVMTLPYSDALFIQAFPRECTESFQEGHRRAFEFFGGVPRRISYDNSKIAVAKILGSRKRKITSEFLRLQPLIGRFGAGAAMVLFNEMLEFLDVRGIHDSFEFDRIAIAVLGKRAGFIDHVTDPSRHAGGEVSPGGRNGSWLTIFVRCFGHGVFPQ